MRLYYLRNSVAYLAIFLLILLLQGCATCAYRFGSPHSDYPKKTYPATKCDLNVLEYIQTEGGGAPWYYIVIVDSGVVLDLPFSLLSDTLLFPYDIFEERDNKPPEKIQGTP